MQDRVFYSICFGFAFGVLLRSFLLINVFSALFLALLFGVLFLFFIFISRRKWPIIISVFVLAFSLGIFRFHLADKPAPQVFESQIGQKFSLTGMLIDEPTFRENNQALTIETNIGEEKTVVFATVSFGNEFDYGDKVSFSGKLEKPENFLTDQGKEFDYINYLRKDGILYLVKYPTIEVVSSGHGNFMKRHLFAFKRNFLSKVNMAVPDPESLLLGGLIVGERSSFGAELRQKFVDTGTIHIVALSGYNVSIVADWIMKMFSFLPRTAAFGAGIGGIILFIIMAGGQATAVRAGVMATLALVARATERTYDVGRGLVIAGVVMIICNPFVLAYDVSFQLSFIATVAVIFLAPRWEKYFMWVTPGFGLRDIVSVTCAAYVFVLPFILYKMGNLSTVALPANILILPLLPLTMVFGFLTGFAGFLHHLVSIPFGYAAYFLLHYELGVVDFFSKLPLASFTVPHFPLLLTLLIYAWFIYKLFGKNIRNFFKKEI